MHAAFQDPILRTHVDNSKMPSTEDFTKSLSDVFKSDRRDHLTAHHGLQYDTSFADIPPFKLSELTSVLQSMRNRKSGDDLGLVLEMFKYGGRSLHEVLLGIYNRMLRDQCLEPSWQESLFKMIPKPGDVAEVSNWRPIAVLRITYKIFAKLIHWRIHPFLDKGQSRDQVGFRHKLGVDHAFAVLETMVGKCIEWREPLWIASLDLRKASDRIEFDSLFHALSD